MMKKIFLFVLGFVMFKVGYSQYPIQQYIGADSAVVTSKGGLQGRLINQVFADTTAANSQRIKQYPGAMIYASGKLWVRNTTATKWTELAYGPIQVTNIYNSDGTLTGSRTLNGNNDDLTFDNMAYFSVSANPTGQIRFYQGSNSNILMRGDTTAISRRLSYNTNLGSSFTKHTLVDKNYVDSSITASPSGTVTSIATNNGTGITGGTITNTGTLAIDTNLISTRAWRQKGIDSVQSNLTSGLALKLNISDTATMLSPYLRKADTTAMLSPYKTFYPRTAISLTTTGSSGAATYNNSTGVLNVPQYADQFTGTVTSVATNTATGITGGTITTTGTLAIDTNLISTRAWRQKGIDSVTSLINARPSGSGTTNYLPKWTSSSALGNSLVFDNGTNVGIGTTSPTAKLVLNQTSTGSQKLSFALNNSEVGAIDINTSTGVAEFSSGYQIRITSNSNSTRFSTNGNVSIASTTNNVHRLEVNGTIGNSLTLRQYVIGGGVTAALPTYSFYGDGSTGIWSPATGVIGVSISGTEAMRLTSSSNLLIGTTTDGGFKLDVNGTARISGALTFGLTPKIESAGGNAYLYMTATGGIQVSSDKWVSNTSASSYIQNGYSTKNFVTTNAANGTFNSFDFSASNAYQPTIANPYTQKLINGAMTINSTAATNSFHGVSISTTDNSASIANNVFAVYADATLGTNTSATRWAGYFVGRGYFSQVLSIGTTSPNASALLDISSTTKGFLPPRMTTAQKNAITSPATGLVVYDTTLNKLSVYTGAGWETVTSL